MANDSSEEAVGVSDWEDVKAPEDLDFPNATNGKLALRLNFHRQPLAELHQHAQSDLEHEVCGVLAGTVYTDKEGQWVEVVGAIRGQSAREGRTEVAFTQETWELIHQSMESDYPDHQIVGWYHTHPGFGVEFSDMDLFVQTNFFPLPTQVAVVTDPLSGQVAACVNTEQGIEYLECFWVDGRQQQCQRPKKGQDNSGTAVALPAVDELVSSVETLEKRVSQLLQVVDEQKLQLYRFQVNLVLFFLVGSALLTFYSLYSLRTSEVEPPRVRSFASVPVRVGEDNVMLGIGVVEWKVPPKLNSLLLQQAELEAAAARGEEESSWWPF